MSNLIDSLIYRQKGLTMKKLLLTLALLSSPLMLNADGFNMPSFNNGNGFNNGSSWSMPTMNWGNGNNSSNNGTNWNMPNMNWGNGNNGNNFGGSNWNIPTMNWGNNGNNGFNNGSNWNMPTMNWGNSNNAYNTGTSNGTNWNMPNMNLSNGNNQPWNFGNNFNNNTTLPNVQYRAPAMPVAPQFIPRLNTQINTQVPVAKKPAIQASATIPTKATIPTTKVIAPAAIKIPMPSEVSGTILAPANKTLSIEGTK